jgi:uncharacterized protein (TIRG00374 family)
LPSILEVFTSWRSLLDVEVGWVALALVFVAASFVSTWALQRLAVGSKDWFAIGTSQLAGNALGRILPGGLATAGALQYRMLVRAGVPGARVASGVAASSALLFATLLGLPVLVVPAVLRGTGIDTVLARSVWLGAASFVLVAVVAVVAFGFNRPLRFVGRVAVALARRIPPLRARADGLPERLVRERNAVRAALGQGWKVAVAASVAKWLFDYLALVASLLAVGVKPSPTAVLLAYVTASLLGMLPFTPGGLGFVEAGLTATLALAGVAGGAAVTATLTYRLASFWLPIPAGLVGYGLFRRRYGGPPASATTLGAASAPEVQAQTARDRDPPYIESP